MPGLALAQQIKETCGCKELRGAVGSLGAGITGRGRPQPAEMLREAQGQKRAGRPRRRGRAGLPGPC